MNQQQQDFEKLFRNELESVNFEISKVNIELLTPIWKKVLDSSSLYSLDCDIVILEQIAKTVYSENEIQFNLFNVSFLLNALTKLSPKELDITMFEYIVFNRMVKELSEKWNEMVMPIRQKLMNKIQTQAALNVPQNGKSVIPPFKGR